MHNTIHIRKFELEDIQQLTLIYNIINGISDTDQAYDTELMLEFLSKPSKSWKHCILAERNNSLIGFSIIHPELQIKRVVASGGVLKSQGYKDAGRQLILASMKHAQSLNVNLIHIEIPSDCVTGKHVLESIGFSPVRSYYQMEWTNGFIPKLTIPDGFSVRNFVLSKDEKLLTELQNTIFTQSWGFCPNTVEEIKSRVRFKLCSEDGIKLLFCGDVPAAFNWTTRTSAKESSTGWISMTGVAPNYRGTGLGMTTILCGMQYLKSKGVSKINLQVDSQNNHAIKIYSKLGFEKIAETTWYEKSLLS